MATTHPPLVRTRLSFMFFFEFLVWGSWGVAITGYAASLGFSKWEIGWLGAIPAVGAIISPLFVGLIADRFFSAQRMLSVLHLFGAACLITAGFQETFWPLLILMMLNGLAFMPTIALVNAIAFRHLPDPDQFPRVAVLGTVGWISAILFASVVLGGAVKPNFLFQAGVGGILMAIYALTLPDTPPKGGAAGGDVFGLRALTLLKEPSFLVFVVCVFLFSIPACGYFFTLMVPMLQERGYPSPLALTSLNQFAELVFMFSMPWFIATLGLKRVVIIGMLAWIIRYVCFSVPSFQIALLGLVLHGFCYSFFYVGAYMYVDKRAPAELKASAQSLLAFLLLGLGWLFGAQFAGYMMNHHSPQVRNMASVLESGSTDTRPLPPWNDPDAATSAWRYLDLSSTVKGLMTGDKPEPVADMAAQLDTNRDGTITMGEVKAIPDSGVKIAGQNYSRDDLTAAFTKIANLEGEGNIPADEVGLTRAQWLAAQSCNWRPIFLWPAGGATIIFVFFALAFHDPTGKSGNKDADDTPT
jgi:nucleoside transporter